VYKIRLDKITELVCVRDVCVILVLYDVILFVIISGVCVADILILFYN